MYECCPTNAVEVESTDELLAHITAHGSLANVVIQGLDLRDKAVAAAVCSVPAEDACLLGCRVTDAVEQHVRRTGGTLFPAFTGLPFHPYRASLYTPDVLMRGYKRGNRDSLDNTLDARIYRYFKSRQPDGHDAPVMDTLAFRIHDHAIDDALSDLLHNNGGAQRKVVGVMGGHQLGRDTDVYRTVAHVGHALTRAGFFVATGGGPGAMEAANLGAALAGTSPEALDAAVDRLATAPHWEDDGYFEAAYAVREQHPDRQDSLAIPTWFYGHEPSNLFAPHVAKYFANSIREDGLLAIAQYGVVYAPGSAGTIQEVFMDAAQNHYETFGPASPMIFLGTDYWTQTKPVYPLLKTLAHGTAYEDCLVLTDDVEAVVEKVRERDA